MNKRNYICLCWTIIISLVFTGCKNDESNTDSQQETWEVTGILSPNGLGDMGYNDKVFLGLCYMRDSLQCTVRTCSPQNFEDAEKRVQEWLAQPASNKVHRLLVLCDSKYIDLVKKDNWQNTAGKDILLCDVNDTTLNIYTRAMLLYGACYAVGRLNGPLSKQTGKNTALVMANNEDWAISEGATGFEEGCAEENIPVDRHYLYDEESRGYSQADSAYHLCYQLAKTTGFILPLAGKSNNGVYRYVRDYQLNELWTCSVDEYDFTGSRYSCFWLSMDMGNLLLQFGRAWKNGTSQSLHSIAGIESGLVEVGVSSVGRTMGLGEKTIEILNEAIVQERKHYAGSNLLIKNDVEAKANEK